MTNSPAEIAERTDITRPMILLSTSGTQLLAAARGAPEVYAACLRYWSAQVRHLVGRHDKIAVIGAGGRGEFRDEDQLCCAWIAEGVLRAGYEAGSDETQRIATRWSGAAAADCMGSKSVAYRAAPVNCGIWSSSSAMLTICRRPSSSATTSW